MRPATRALVELEDIEYRMAIVREYAAAYSKIMEAWRRDKINRPVT